MWHNRCVPAYADQFWLIKSEPSTYSIDDLQRDVSEHWDGVRNYQARNFMREMNLGNEVLFYHSSAHPPGVVGLAKICCEAYPDHTQFDSNSPYYDAKSDPDKPCWWMVDVEFMAKFDRIVSLEMLKKEAALEGMRVIQRGQRLSVMPVKKAHFQFVLKLARSQP